MDELALVLAVVVLLFIVLIGPLLLLRVLFPVHGGSIAVGMIATAVFVPFAIWMFLRGSRHPDRSLLQQLRDVSPMFGGLLLLWIIESVIKGFDRKMAMDVGIAAVALISLVAVPFLLGRAVARRASRRLPENQPQGEGPR